MVRRGCPGISATRPALRAKLNALSFARSHVSNITTIMSFSQNPVGFEKSSRKSGLTGLRPGPLFHINLLYVIHLPPPAAGYLVSVVLVGAETRSDVEVYNIAWFEPVPKLIDCALTRTVLGQALAVFEAFGLPAFILTKPRISRLPGKRSLSPQN
jgi:hypothetical protein